MSAGTLERGILTPWSAEEQLQLDYLHLPTDGFSLKFQRSWKAMFPIQDGEKLWFRQSFKGTEGIAKLSDRPPVFVLRREDLRDVSLQCCSSGNLAGLTDVIAQEGQGCCNLTYFNSCMFSGVWFRAYYGPNRCRYAIGLCGASKCIGRSCSLSAMAGHNSVEKVADSYRAWQ